MPPRETNWRFPPFFPLTENHSFSFYFFDPRKGGKKACTQKKKERAYAARGGGLLR